MAKSINSKSTKAEILDAYEALLQEKQALASQLGEGSTPAAPPAPTPTPQPPAKDVSMPSSTPAPTTIESTLDSLATLQFGFGSALSHLSEQQVAEAVQLQEL